jgi:hypothetical protein
MRKAVLGVLLFVAVSASAGVIYLEAVGFPICAIGYSMTKVTVKAALGLEVTCADFPPEVRRGMPSCLI